jgi:hypothetical protein
MMQAVNAIYGIKIGASAKRSVYPWLSCLKHRLVDWIIHSIKEHLLLPPNFQGVRKA